MTRTLVISGNKLKLRTHATFNGAEYDTIASNLDSDTINDICRNNGLIKDGPISAPYFSIEGNKLYLFTTKNEKKLLCADMRASYVSSYDFSEAIKFPVDKS